MNIDSVYTQLTGVNIAEQQQLWDERGKGYYGEYLVFSELCLSLPGFSKILMNVQIPGTKAEKTELDLVLLHETGIYVFEIKHYKGTIYGSSNQERWTQYFRTTKNSHFYSPVFQNRGHIEALRAIFPSMPFFSFIVFTNPDVDLRVKNSEPNVVVCRLHEMMRYLSDVISTRRQTYFSMDQLDSIFSTLLPYAPVMETTIYTEKETMPLYRYVEFVNNDLNSKKAALELDSKSARKKHLLSCIAASAAIVAVSVSAAVIYAGSVNLQADKSVSAALATAQAATEQYEKMKRSFTEAEPLSESGFELKDDFLTVSNVTLREDDDIDNSTVLDGTLAINSDQFWVEASEGSAFVITLTDGRVISQKVISADGPFPARTQTHLGGLGWKTETPFCKDGRLTRFIGVSPEEISYIKITNLLLHRNAELTTIRDNLEVEVYKK